MDEVITVRSSQISQNYKIQADLVNMHESERRDSAQAYIDSSGH